MRAWGLPKAKCARETASRPAVVVVMTVAAIAAVFAAACSGDGDAKGAATETGSPPPVVSETPQLTPTGTASPTATKGAAATTTPTAVGPTSTPDATATPTSTPAATPVPTASPTPVQPGKHLNGTFTIVVEQGDARVAVHVEVAATLAQRQQGLMFRTQLGEDEGMLFLFDRDVQTGFWMRNTLVPLDIAYIGADLRVNEIKQGTPLDETPLVPAGRYRYVLEVNQGWFERHGLGPGARIELPGGLPAPSAN